MNKPTTTTTSDTDAHVHMTGTNEKDEKGFLNATEVARKLRVGKTALYGWLAWGYIAYHRVGRLIRIHESDVAAFLAREVSDCRRGARGHSASGRAPNEMWTTLLESRGPRLARETTGPPYAGDERAAHSAYSQPNWGASEYTVSDCIHGVTAMLPLR